MSYVRFKFLFLFIGLIAVLSISAITGVGGSAKELRTGVGGDSNLASIVRGGRLYDNWIEELGESEPLITHPAYPAAEGATGGVAATWRCKECHGWDYRGRDGAYGKGIHFTGIIGIQRMNGAAPDEIIAVLKDKTHDYEEVLRERDYQDLANFVSRGQVHMDRFIDRTTKAAKADARPNKVFFETICANCHGIGGQKFRHIPALGKIVSVNPWEAFHKILNGHPGETMPALRVFGKDRLIGILAYAQTLPKEEALASIVQGGRLYDNWYAATDKSPPDIHHPLYPASESTKSKIVTWRCISCHGWDYRGRASVFSDGKQHTSIRHAAGADPEAIMEVLTDAKHGYGEMLSRRELRNVATFVSKGQVDMDRYIDRRSKLAKGNSNRNVAFYTTICATCHGPKGFEISTMPPLGQVARENPWSALHGMLNGHPDEEMPALRALNINVLVDILAYIQTLPTRK